MYEFQWPRGAPNGVILPGVAARCRNPPNKLPAVRPHRALIPAGAISYQRLPQAPLNVVPGNLNTDHTNVGVRPVPRRTVLANRGHAGNTSQCCNSTRCTTGENGSWTRSNMSLSKMGLAPQRECVQPSRDPPPSGPYSDGYDYCDRRAERTADPGDDPTPVCASIQVLQPELRHPKLVVELSNANSSIHFSLLCLLLL